MRKLHVHVLSDSHGETADIVSKAAFSQFPDVDSTFTRHAFIETKDDILSIINAVRGTDCLIIYTLVVDELRDYLAYLAHHFAIRCVDVMGPVLREMADYLGKEPEMVAGRLEPLDEEYFQRIDAIEFAVKYDDGKDPRGVLKSDITLIGVSRTSKTPLSMYLANRGYKVANIPLVPEVEPPKELYSVNPKKIFGLLADPRKLNSIRTERLRALGLTSENSTYAQMDRIRDELKKSEQLMSALGCYVIDVTSRAIEETAGIIIERVQKNQL